MTRNTAMKMRKFHILNGCRPQPVQTGKVRYSVDYDQPASQPLLDINIHRHCYSLEIEMNPQT